MFRGVVRGIILPIAIAAVASFGTAAGAAAQSSHSSATNNSNSNEKITPSERTFIKNAAEGGMAEVEFGRLATEKAESPDVKQFGQRMVDDHTKAGDQLKQVASEEGVSLPTKLDAKDAATKARLEKLSGKAFDRAYMRDMVLDHTKDVREFRMESKTAKDSSVKNFAAQTLPTLEDHLKEAKSIEPKVVPHHTQRQKGTT